MDSEHPRRCCRISRGHVGFNSLCLVGQTLMEINIKLYSPILQIKPAINMEGIICNCELKLRNQMNRMRQESTYAL